MGERNNVYRKMTKIKHQGKIIEVVHEDVEINGKKKTFEFARRSPGVRLIIPHKNGFLISKEYRHELKDYDYRLPGGKVFDSLKEYNQSLKAKTDIVKSAEQTARREAREEVGIDVKKLSFLHKSICGATVIWDLFYFKVIEFEQKDQKLEEGEDITVEWVSAETAKEMCLDGRIREERSAPIFLRYLNGEYE